MRKTSSDEKKNGSGIEAAFHNLGVSIQIQIQGESQRDKESQVTRSAENEIARQKHSNQQ
jgi:hypothetical protein